MQTRGNKRLSAFMGYPWEVATAGATYNGWPMPTAPAGTKP